MEDGIVFKSFQIRKLDIADLTSIINRYVKYLSHLEGEKNEVRRDRI